MTHCSGDNIEVPSAGANSISSPVTLALEAVLPTADQSTVDLNDDKPQLLWFEDEAWLHRIQDDGNVPLNPLPEGFQVPDVCYWSLLGASNSTALGKEDYTLYLDGSANSQTAAWSVVVTQHCGGDESYIGCAHGTVSINPVDPQWIGASTLDNISGELTAMAAAQNIALRWPSKANFSIRPDLSLSHTLALSTTTCKSNRCCRKFAGRRDVGCPARSLSMRSEDTQDRCGTNWRMPWPNGPCTTHKTSRPSSLSLSTV